MKLSLSIESEEPGAVAPARWPSANFVTKVADALLHLSAPRPASTDRAGPKIHIGSEDRGKVLSRKI